MMTAATKENLDLNESVEMKTTTLTTAQIDEESELNTSVPVDSNADEINTTTMLAESSNENGGVDETTGSLMENGINKSSIETSQEDTFGSKVKEDSASSYDELIVSHPPSLYFFLYYVYQSLWWVSRMCVSPKILRFSF